MFLSFFKQYFHNNVDDILKKEATMSKLVLQRIYYIHLKLIQIWTFLNDDYNEME